MKVLQVNSVCTGASTGTICTQLAQLITANSGESLIAYGRGESVASIRSYRIEKRSEFLFHVLLSRLTDRQGFFSASATKKLCDLIRQYDPDIIHLHNLHGYYLNLEVLFQALEKSDKPIVMTLHDCWTLTGHCAYLGDCAKWRTGCGHCPKTHTYPSALVDKSSRNLKDKARLFTLPDNVIVVTPSHWLADQVKQSFLSGYPLKVIPNGIDLKIFKPTENDFKIRYGITGKMVLGVANFRDRNKGLADFIELSNAVPECRVVLVGLNKKQIKSLPEGMIGLPRISNPAELAKIYSAADVFVNPTYADNFPTVNLEAPACGTPIVTYDTGGSAEAIQACGKAVPTGDREALFAAVQAMLKNPPSREQCVRQALSHDKNERFKEYIRLYDELTAKRATR